MRVSAAAVSVADSYDQIEAAGSDAELAAEVQQRFARSFAQLAEDPAAFHALLDRVLGQGYDREAAEGIRQRALQGDFSWLPEVQLVSSQELGGANGAYDARSGTVLLNRELDVDTLAQTYVEETGHDLDAGLNDSDAAGDEGELFRRLLSGEVMDQAQIDAIQAEDDRGLIIIDGEQREVEFWNPFKAAKNVVSSAVDVVVDVATTVVDTVVSAPATVAGAVVDAGGALASGLWGGIKEAGVGSWDATKDFFGSAIKGDFAGAFEAATRFVDNLAFQAPRRVLTGAINGAEHLVNGAVDLIPFESLRAPIREFTDRGFSVARDVTTKAVDIHAGIYRDIVEAGTTFASGLGKISRGEFKEGFKDLAGGAWKATLIPAAVNATIFAGHTAISAVQTLAGLEAPGRHLTDAEVDEMRRIFGDSIDYSAVIIKEGDAGLFRGDRAFVVGNTIYLKNVQDDPATALDEKMAVLVSEMTHVWQFQNGGTDYAAEAIYSQNWGAGYRWREDVPAKPWGELEPEQQDALLRYAYEQGAFNTDPPVLVDHVTGTNLTDYLRAALADIRAGRGAP